MSAGVPLRDRGRVPGLGLTTLTVLLNRDFSPATTEQGSGLPNDRPCKYDFTKILRLEKWPGVSGYSITNANMTFK